MGPGSTRMSRKPPLSHIRVLDLSRVLAGPLAAQTLGDLGAEVIRVERAGSGDDARRMGPPFLKDTEGRDTRETPIILGANRNKKSITLNLAAPEGQDIVRRLAAGWGAGQDGPFDRGLHRRTI
jgi:crotonobetainyl-CoA:carnitine CoA-transferase CaiB-like acyl-CoA transferase